MRFIEKYLDDIVQIAKKIDPMAIRKAVDVIADVKERGGRLFIIGSGGGAGHASHAVNDFRKIANIEAYTPTDNVSELTARINDEGWDHSYSDWLKISNLNRKDGILVFSVGGGNIEFGLSVNLVEAMKLAKSAGASIIGVVGRDGGETAKLGDAPIIVPEVNKDLTTALVESYQAVIWHLIVSHPKLYATTMKWESVDQNRR